MSYKKRRRGVVIGERKEQIRGPSLTEKNRILPTMLKEEGHCFSVFREKVSGQQP